MSRREDVDNSIWVDPDFSALSLEAAHLYLWSFTNSHCNMAGLYKIGRRTMSFETKLSPKRLTLALRELEEANFLHYHEGVLWVRSRVKHLRSRNPNIAKSICRDVAALDAQHPLRVAFLHRYQKAAWLRDQLSSLTTVDEAVVFGSSKPKQETVRPLDRLDRLQTVQGKGKGYKTPSTSEDKVPDDVPARLRAAVPAVRDVLVRVASGKGAIPPTLAAVGRAVASYPDRDHVQAAGDLEHWLLHGTGMNRPVRDVVGFYRNQLDRSPVVSVGRGVEHPADRRVRELLERASRLEGGGGAA